MMEIEVKAFVSNAGRILALMGTPDRTEEQSDTYYAHPARDFAATDEALRLRVVGEHFEITWKGPKVDSTTKTREEVTLPIPDRKDGERFLEALGFRPVGRVEKRRQIWLRDGLTYALDHVVGLGTFVEIEAMAESDASATKARVLEGLQKLGLEQTERRSYLELLLAKGAARA
jgi:adenylate cyclase class 2